MTKPLFADEIYQKVGSGSAENQALEPVEAQNYKIFLGEGSHLLQRRTFPVHHLLVRYRFHDGPSTDEFF